MGVTSTHTAAQAKSKIKSGSRTQANAGKRATGDACALSASGRGQAPVAHRERAHAPLHAFGVPTVSNMPRGVSSLSCKSITFCDCHEISISLA